MTFIDMNGWISLHRKILDSRVFANEGLLKVWIYCLCRANHKKTYALITIGRGQGEVELLPGQFLFGRNSAANDLNMNPTTVRKRIMKLEKMGNISVKSDSHYSVVTICNWEYYQDIENKKCQPSDNQVTSKGQPSDTDNNDNNGNNDNNTSVTDISDDVPTASDYETWQSAIRISDKLLKAICDSDPTHKYNRNPPSRHQWVKDIDLAIRRDGRTEEQFNYIITAVFYECDKHPKLWEGWKVNVMSGAKLREKFDTIKNQIKQSHEQSINKKISDTEQFLTSYEG